MQTMTVRGIECLSAKDRIFPHPVDFGKRLRRFQRHIETSDWDQRLIHFTVRFDKVFLFVAILLAVSFFLSWWV